MCLLVIWLVGCVPGNSNVSTGNTANPANAAPPANAAQPAPETAANSNVPVTLPLIDAMLADEAFTNELRSNLQLTDEELQKLRDAARNGVLQLSYEDDDAARSTSAATGQAQSAVREILGNERSTRFMALIRTKSAGIDQAQFADVEPNSVPTDTRIVVNAPAYRMDVFENGQLKKSYKIGIGYPEFPLPAGLRRAETVIINPTWTPPDEPWVKGKFAPGKTVEAGSKDNPLGILKIPIGLPSLIHGGKVASRLGTFASHGCVGLTNDQARDFAVQLAALGGSPLSQEEIRKFNAQKTETKEHKLQNPVPVELRYETIVVQDGKLYIYRDVYERGTNTEENLRRVLEAAGLSLDSINPQSR